MADYRSLFPQYTATLAAYEVGFGEENVYKLTQKYRSETQNVYETTITNLYLTEEEEYNHLASLAGKMIKKKRYPYSVQNHTYSMDVFEGRHQGLILAEFVQSCPCFG